MQHLQPGELIGLEFRGDFYLFIILSKSAFFGCQWSFAFHQSFSSLPSENNTGILSSTGFVALIDFIEERRANSIYRLKKDIDVSPYLAFQYMKAFIRGQNGGDKWFIYARNFQILEKKNILEPSELDYPIASGMKASEAFELMDSKWTPRDLVSPGESGQFPRVGMGLD